jgi:hypothetical protein
VIETFQSGAFLERLATLAKKSCRGAGLDADERTTLAFLTHAQPPPPMD